MPFEGPKFHQIALRPATGRRNHLHQIARSSKPPLNCKRDTEQLLQPSCQSPLVILRRTRLPTLSHAAHVCIKGTDAVASVVDNYYPFKRTHISESCPGMSWLSSHSPLEKALFIFPSSVPSSAANKTPPYHLANSRTTYVSTETISCRWQYGSPSSTLPRPFAPSHRRHSWSWRYLPVTWASLKVSGRP